MLSALLKDIYKTNDPEKHNAIVNLTKSRLKDLQEETKKMSENEKKKWKVESRSCWRNS